MTRITRLLHHLPALAAFSALAVAWTWPLALHISTHIPGPPGDNIAFLWNSWWARAAGNGHTGSLYTDAIFAPAGIDLTLHTHTVLASSIAATLLGSWSLITAHNVTMLLTLTLNGFAAYLLAWDRLRHRGSALIAGVIFGGSPYLTAHLLGHVNLLSAWGIPLFTLCLLRAFERRSWRAAAGAGVVVVATAYSDYYYVVYCAAIAVVVSAAFLVTVEWRRRTPTAAVRALLLGLLALDLCLVAAVVFSGGFTAEPLGLRIVARRPTNLLAFAWLLATLLLFQHTVPRLRRRVPLATLLVPLLPMVAVVVIGMAPLLRRAWSLLLAGDFAGPSASWRSGPAGIDLATIVMGHPWHGVVGGAVRTWYDRWAVSPIEGIGWMGVVPVLLTIAAFRRRADALRVWRWLFVAFLVWALGPWLHVFGADLGLLLPQNLLAHLPIVSNARMPGRAMVVVFMAVSMLAASVLARRPNRPWWLALVLIAVVAEYWPSPFPLTRIEVPAIYERLQRLPPGTVCELPVGMRDGFGTTGRFDDWTLAYQMVHGHPLVGGFAARIPPSVRSQYDRLPVLRSLLQLSSGGVIDAADAALTRAEAAASLQRTPVTYLMLNRTLASAALISYVEQGIGTRLLAADGDRSLYELNLEP